MAMQRAYIETMLFLMVFSIASMGSSRPKVNSMQSEKDELSFIKGIGNSFYCDICGLEHINKGVLETAVNALAVFKSTEETRADYRNIFKLDSNDDVFELTLGIPYERKFLNLVHASGRDAGEKVELEDSQMWIFPVVFKGQYISLIKIAHHDGDWQHVETGPTGGAEFIEESERRNNFIGERGKRYVVTSLDMDEDYIAYVKKTGGIQKSVVYVHIKDRNNDEKEIVLNWNGFKRYIINKYDESSRRNSM